MGAYKWILREGDDAEHFNRIVEKKAMEMLEEDFSMPFASLRGNCSSNQNS